VLAPANPATLIQTIVALLAGESKDIMPGARTLNTNASYPPQALGMLGELFDEVWASVAADFAHYPDEIETARIRLTTIIRDLADDGEFGPLQITRTAAALMRQTLSQGPHASLPGTKSAAIER
jgi:hypothetical protein